MRWLLIFVFLATLGVACGSSSDSDSESNSEVNMADEETTTTASGLQIKVIEIGTGDKAEAGKTAVVHYTGWLLDGRIGSGSGVVVLGLAGPEEMTGVSAVRQKRQKRAPGPFCRAQPGHERANSPPH